MLTYTLNKERHSKYASKMDSEQLGLVEMKVYPH